MVSGLPPFLRESTVSNRSQGARSRQRIAADAAALIEQHTNLARNANF
jgi:hypothetical protein